jgi:serine/threonine protein kinase
MDGVRTRLAGRYDLEQVIGRGGMSTVYRATDALLGRTVAVKVLSPALAEGDPVWAARFEREARAAASLSHSGVATVYDTGVEDGTRFIVMECVAGKSLAAILHDEAPLEAARAVQIGAQIADVLTAAHAAGIVHRDIKPGNVMVGPDGTVTVLDFGIARPADATGLTQTMSLLGTAAYMAPEQASGQPADARSDIYSLGCVLYATLSGAPPFTGDFAAAVLHQHLNAAPRPVRDVAPATPKPLAGLIDQMLAKSPGVRPQSAEEVRDRLLAALHPTAPMVAIGSGVAAARTAPTPPLTRRPRRRFSRRGSLAATAGLVLVIAALTVAKGGGSSRDNLFRHQTTSPPTTTVGRTAPPRAKNRAPAKPTPPPKTTKATPPANQAQLPGGRPGHGGPPPGQAKKHHGGVDGGGNQGDGGD